MTVCCFGFCVRPRFTCMVCSCFYLNFSSFFFCFLNKAVKTHGVLSRLRLPVYRFPSLSLPEAFYDCECVCENAVSARAPALLHSSVGLCTANGQSALRRQQQRRWWWWWWWCWCCWVGGGRGGGGELQPASPRRAGSGGAAPRHRAAFVRVIILTLSLCW